MRVRDAWTNQPSYLSDYYSILLYRDENGSITREADVTEFFDSLNVGSTGYSGISSGAVSGNGSLCLAVEHDLVMIFDPELNYTGTVSFDRGQLIGIAVDGEGDIYAYLSAANLSGYICKIDTQRAAYEEVYRDVDGLAVVPSGFACVPDGFVTYWDGDIYLYDTAAKTLRSICTLADLGIRKNQVNWLGTTEDGKILLHLANGAVSEFVALTKTPRDEALVKTTLHLAALTVTNELEKAIADFNKYSNEYKVEITQFYDAASDKSIGGSGYNDAVMKFNMEIISGSADIYSIPYDMAADYSARGIFADLTDYYAGSKMEIMDDVLAAMTFNERLYVLPISCQVRTLAAIPSRLEHEGGWTLEEFLDYFEEHPDEKLLDADSKALLEICLTMNLGRYVDTESGTADFHREDFYRVLEFCARNGARGASKEDISPELTCAYTGTETVLHDVYVTDLRDYNVLYQAMSGRNVMSAAFALSRKAVMFPGLPSDGSGYLLSFANGVLAINAKSINPDGAWAFVEGVMTSTLFDTGEMLPGFPTDSGTREKLVKTLLSSGPKDGFGDRKSYESYRYNADGNLSFRFMGADGELLYWFYALVPYRSEIEPIEQVLESAVPQSVDSKIMEFVTEAAEKYFKGDQSAEQTAAMIENKVRLYLGERG